MLGILAPRMSIRGPLGATPESGAFELNATALERRVASSRSRALFGQLGLLGVLLTGLTLTVTAAHTDAILPESVRPIPGWLAGPLGGDGLGLHVAPLLLVLALMFISYVAVTLAGTRLSGRAVLAAIAALHAFVLLAPPLLSTDVFSYQAYARMGAMYGVSPYLHGPHAIALDPVYPFIGWKWVTMPSAYGPVFTLLSYILAPLSIAASALAYKAIAAVSSLILVALVWNAARLRGLDPVRAAAFVGLNPLVVLYGVGGGHNDLLMLAVALAGVYLMLARRERAGAGSLVLATAVKLTGGLLLPFALAGAGGPRMRHRRRDVLIGSAVATACVSLVTLAAFATAPLHMLGTLQKGQSEGDWHSIPGVIATKLGAVTIGRIVGLILAAAFVMALVWLIRRVWRGTLDWIDGAGWATVLLLITASALLPWYVAWLIPLAALAGDRRLRSVSLVMTGLVMAIQMLGYVPHTV